MELVRDSQLIKHFEKFVSNMLARNKNYDIKRFIGGLPITLEKKDVINLSKLDPFGKSFYTVTQKVDGTRVLMYIGPRIGDSPKRVLCFVDRNMNLYTLRNKERDVLPYVDIREEMLLDGELVFFNSEGNSFKELEFREVTGVSFMAFDILYGPSTVNTVNKETILGQSVSMILPFDNIPRATPWTYIQRYDILYKLIETPPYSPDMVPKLTFALKDIPWFNIELKPIYFLSSIPPEIMFNGIYNDINTAFLQYNLKIKRKSHYALLKKKYEKSNTSVFVSKRLVLDGLIFTSTKTLYTIGTWNKFDTEQFKWKPQNEQTIDLKIKKISKTTANVLVTSNKEEVLFQKAYKPVIVSIPEIIKDGEIVEFKFNKNGDFEIKDVRKDKKTPNSLNTVLNVINSFKNPVVIKDLYYFFNKSHKESLKKILEYSSKNKLLNCIALNGKIKYIPDVQEKSIKEMISTIDPSTDNEVELRLGIIGKGFNPHISREEFIAYLNIVRGLKFVENIEDFVDLYNEYEDGNVRIRTRHKYSKEFEKYILLDSINKKRILNVDVNLKAIAGFDVRFSRSSEKLSDIYNLTGDGQRKYRLTYTHPDNLYRIDFTAISDVTFLDRMFTQKQDSRETFQIEVELLSKDVDLDDLLTVLLKIFSKR
jgi:hypothetical protein